MAILGHGSKLIIVGPFGGTAVTLTLACLSIDPGSNKIDTPDSTDMLTPGAVRTFGSGLETPGDITVKYNSNPTDTAQAALVAAKGVPYIFQIEYPGGTWYEDFVGIVNSIDESIPDDKFITKTAKIQKTGPTSASATATAPTTMPTAQTSGYSQ